MKKTVKTIIGVAVGYFFSLIIYSKLEEWMPCTVPVPGQYNVYSSVPIFNFSSMSILEYILVFLILIAPMILSAALLLYSESPGRSLQDSIRMILSLAVGIFTSILIFEIPNAMRMWEFEGFGYNDTQWYDWIMTFSVVLVPTSLALWGAYDFNNWLDYLWRGILLPCIAGILVNISLFMLMTLVYLVVSGMILELIFCILLFMAVTGPSGKLIIIILGG